MPNMNLLRTSAVDAKHLASNFISIISDCAGTENYTLRNALQDRYPLATWLLNTSFARMMRSMSVDPQHMRQSTTEGVDWEMDIPGTVYTLEPSNSGTDCCWTIPDFAKCAGVVPLDYVCLKDCDNIFNTMVYERLRINSRTSLERFAREGETLEEVEARIRRMWMAFYTMHTAILGTRTTSDNITKPFHGLLEVMQNDAVISISGANLLAAFDSVGCRLDILGSDGFRFACNPLIYRSIEAAIKPDQFGNLPEGWSKNGGLSFHGVSFIQDKLIPVDIEDMVGDVWLMDEESVGLFLAYNVDQPYEISDVFTEQSKADGCGQVCNYLYNYGTVANNNANRLMVISGVPVSATCTLIADLAGLINPTTLVPAV